MPTARINGVSLAYRDAGSGMPILFIHGHPFNQSMWDSQVAALTWKYRVITYDIRGYGASEVPATEATTLETMASDINALLDHLNIPKAVIAGLSMGGQIAMAFADQFPHRLSGLILAATFPQADTEEAIKTRRATADRFINQGSVLPGGEMLPKLIAPASLKKNPAIAVDVFTMIATHSPRRSSRRIERPRPTQGLHRIPHSHHSPHPHRRRHRRLIHLSRRRKADAPLHPELPHRNLRRHRPPPQPRSHQTASTQHYTTS